MTSRRERTLPPVWAIVLVGLATGLAVSHALAVAPHYRVGSFDDDAGYILAATALAHGAGLTSTLTAGVPLAAVYPPGYPALLAPLVLLGGHDASFRGLTLVLMAALFPLLWRYLERRQISLATRLGILVLLALNPVLATYATMVMAEVPFIVVLVVSLLLVERWEDDPRTLSGAGVAAVISAAGLLWLKEAGIGLVIGLVLWLVIRRTWKKAAATLAGTAILFAPVVIARAIAGTSLIGSRYSSDLGNYYTGGLFHRIVHVVPHSFASFVATALPLSIVPTGSPLKMHGLLWDGFDVLRWTAAPLVLLGLIVWLRNHRDAAVLMVIVYTLETLFYPYINERRVILILPIVVAWYVLGATTAARLIRGAVRTLAGTVASYGARTAMVAVIALPAYALIAQFPRDYLFAKGQSSSAPKGSPYMSFLAALRPPSNVVETSYRFTTALYSGHRTATNVFALPCDPARVSDLVRGDNASFLLSAALNRPDIVDNDCVLGVASSQPWAVRLYRTGRDLASVFEVVGPGTPHPDLSDLSASAAITSPAGPVTLSPEAAQSPGDQAGQFPSVASSGTSVVLTWDWGRSAAVHLVSLGAARSESGQRGGVVVELQGPDRQWRPVISSTTAVGDGTPTPWLLRQFDQPVIGRAARVRVEGPGRVEVHDLHVVGVSV